jgi:hypothetical protein
MESVTSVEFTYKSRKYYALIRRRFSNSEKQFHVTVMNSGLETLLYGHDVFVADDDGGFHVASCVRNNDAKELISSIINACQQYKQEKGALIEGA